VHGNPPRAEGDTVSQPMGQERLKLSVQEPLTGGTAFSDTLSRWSRQSGWLRATICPIQS